MYLARHENQSWQTDRQLFLFLGPTGSGKTRLVEATAESLVGDARA